MSVKTSCEIKIGQFIEVGYKKITRDITSYVSTKFIKENLTANQIAEAIAKMPDFTGKLDKLYYDEINAIDMNPEYNGEDARNAAHLKALAAKKHALEDILYMVDDGIDRAVSFAKTAAVCEVFGNKPVDDSFINRAWKLTENVAPSSNLKYKIDAQELAKNGVTIAYSPLQKASHTANRISTFFDILQLLRDVSCNA